MSDKNLVPVDVSMITDIAISRPPDIVLSEARKAAVALQEVISKKKNPVIFNGEQYLEFEDWQTVGRFYGITAKIVSTNPVEIGGAVGFEARAVAIHVASGQEVSAAEALCLNDEPNWSTRKGIKVPLFQLRSMAQTRAAAKCLRNVLAWVVVLAGYKPTPAEEMIGNEKLDVDEKFEAEKALLHQRMTEVYPNVETRKAKYQQWSGNAVETASQIKTAKGLQKMWDAFKGENG